MKAGKALDALIEWYEEDPIRWAKLNVGYDKRARTLYTENLVDSLFEPENIRSVDIYGAFLIFFGGDNTHVAIAAFQSALDQEYNYLFMNHLDFNDSDATTFQDVMRVLKKMKENQYFCQLDLENDTLGIQLRSILGRVPISDGRVPISDGRVPIST